MLRRLPLPRSLLAAVAWAGLAACAPKGEGALSPEAPTAPVATERYRVEVTSRFETEGRFDTGDPAVPGEPVPALEPLAAFEEARQMVVSLGLVRTFRDDSRGELLRYEEVRSTVRRGGREVVVDPHPLEGRSVEIRRFDTGEILSVDLAQHVVGGDRQAEVYDLVLPLISPKVPALRKGERLTWNTRWPIQAEGAGKVTGMLRLEWKLEGSERLDGVPAWRFTYTGDWRTRALDDTAAGRRVESDSPGRAEGELWLAREDAAPLRHAFRWERTLSLPYPDAPGGPVTVTQRQAFEGVVERIP